MQGVLNLLSNTFCEYSKILMANFVFKIIPMLNPDGVSRGYWRRDILGTDLNRVYENPSRELHPTIYATRNEIMKVFNQGPFQLALYVDFHAHSTKSGAFMFGNSTKTSIKEQTLPKLISMNTKLFDFDQCVFYLDNINLKKLSEISRQGTGRRVIFQLTKLPTIYTFEVNYAVYNNHRGQTEVYTQQDFIILGEQFLLSILNYYNLNPVAHRDFTIPTIYKHTSQLEAQHKTRLRKLSKKRTIN